MKAVARAVVLKLFIGPLEPPELDVNGRVYVRVVVADVAPEEPSIEAAAGADADRHAVGLSELPGDLQALARFLDAVLVFVRAEHVSSPPGGLETDYPGVTRLSEYS